MFKFASKKLSTAGDHPEEGRIVRIGAYEDGKKGVLESLGRQLDFVSYYGEKWGRNWDALLDCLRDLSWIPEKTISITHEKLPSLSSSDLKAYLDVLNDAIETQAKRGEHSLLVFFPDQEKEKLSAIAQTLE